MRRGAGRYTCAIACGAVALLGPAVAAGQVPEQNLLAPKTIAVGGSATAVGLSADGKTLFSVRHDAVPSGSFARIDTLTGNVLSTAAIGTGFAGRLALHPSLDRAYVAVATLSGSVVSSGANRVAVLDTAAGGVLPPIPIAGQTASSVTVTPDGQRLYVSDRGSNRVYAVDIPANAVSASIAVSNGPYGLAVTPDGSRVYVANRTSHSLAVIATATNSVVATIPLSLAASPSTAQLAIAPDGKRAYVVLAGDSRIAIVDTDPSSSTYNTQVALIPTGQPPLFDVVVDPDGGVAADGELVEGPLVLAASAAGDRLVAVDVKPGSLFFHQIVGRIPVGDAPVGIAAGGPLGTLAYTADFAGGTVTRIGVDDYLLARVRALGGQ
jgi:YVTN family beta-propeller protein